MDHYLINTESFQLTQADFLIRVVVAIGIGGIIGLEREHAALTEKVKSFAGIRTFVFVVMLGFMASLVFHLFTPTLSIIISVAVVMITGISYYITASKGEIGATTEFSLIISFLLGMLVFIGYVEISLMLMVVVVVLLSAKLKFRSIVGRITAEELYDFIRFVVIALLLFPFLPDTNVGPYDSINPHQIGWVILLTSGLGFVGYVLMKFLGEGKGILLSGVVGGLVSSTAVTWVFAKKSKEHPELSSSCAVAILAASSLMILRVLVWTYVFNLALFSELFVPLIVVFVAGISVTFYFYSKQKEKTVDDTTIRKGKSLDLPGAFLFGIIYVIILIVVNSAHEEMGDKGLLISSGIAGLSDIDAITITVSKLVTHPIEFSTAGNALLIATISNTLVKMGIGLWAGSESLRKYLYVGYGVVVATALLVLLF